MHSDQIDYRIIKSNGYFGLLENPVEHKQHQNQQKGLDLYVRVLNIDTGEQCFKKLYKNTKGLHFKHTGYPTMYMSDFEKEDCPEVIYVPYQVIELNYD